MIEFFVAGVPKGAGSKRAFVVHPKGGGKPRAIITDVVDTKKAGGNWRSDVRDAAERAMAGAAPLDVPLVLSITFLMPRPKAQFRRDGLRPDAPTWHTTTPDATKLVRSLEDALTGIVYVDDKLVVVQLIEKRYAAADGRVGAAVRIRPTQ